MLALFLSITLLIFAFFEHMRLLAVARLKRFRKFSSHLPVDKVVVDLDVA